MQNLWQITLAAKLTLRVITLKLFSPKLWAPKGIFKKRIVGSPYYDPVHPGLPNIQTRISFCLGQLSRRLPVYLLSPGNCPFNSSLQMSPFVFLLHLALFPALQSDNFSSFCFYRLLFCCSFLENRGFSMATLSSQVSANFAPPEARNNYESFSSNSGFVETSRKIEEPEGLRATLELRQLNAVSSALSSRILRIRYFQKPSVFNIQLAKAWVFSPLYWADIY